MVSEEQILLYYLKIFSIIFFILFLFITKTLFYDKISLKNEFITIQKNQSIIELIEKNFDNLNYFNKYIYYFYLNLYNKFKYIHFGNFKLEKNSSILNITSIITNPSNIIKKITIVEGWNEYQLENLLKKHFEKYETLNYNFLIADTYFINTSNDFKNFKENLIYQKNKLQKKYENHNLLKKFTFDEILIIGSLIEKEGIDNIDKKKIKSVIFNRISKKMRLQIDASVIYSITKGKYKFSRQLTKNDLKIKDSFNTYFIDYLPPTPICYVGTKTIELIFEDYKSDYLYYFFNDIEEIHIFSKNYKEHLNKLNEYRKKN